MTSSGFTDILLIASGSNVTIEDLDRATGRTRPPAKKVGGVRKEVKAKTKTKGNGKGKSMDKGKGKSTDEGKGKAEPQDSPESKTMPTEPEERGKPLSSLHDNLCAHVIQLPKS